MDPRKTFNARVNLQKPTLYAYKERAPHHTFFRGRSDIDDYILSSSNQFPLDLRNTPNFDSRITPYHKPDILKLDSSPDISSSQDFIKSILKAPRNSKNITSGGSKKVQFTSNLVQERSITSSSVYENSLPDLPEKPAIDFETKSYRYPLASLKNIEM